MADLPDYLLLALILLLTALSAFFSSSTACVIWSRRSIRALGSPTGCCGARTGCWASFCWATTW
jgi:Na+/H+ antiporter NhaD/arsenite permease-like protein